MTKWIIQSEEKGERLDVFLLDKIENKTRSAIKHLIEDGVVLVNQGIVKAGYCLKENDEVLLGEIIEREPNAEPQDIPIDIVYEDDDIIVVNKAEGMVVHPAPGNPVGTLVNALLFHCKDGLSGVGGVIRPGIVHRIDKDTGGLLVVAKNDAAHLFLSEEIKLLH